MTMRIYMYITMAETMRIAGKDYDRASVYDKCVSRVDTGHCVGFLFIHRAPPSPSQNPSALAQARI